MRDNKESPILELSLPLPWLQTMINEGKKKCFAINKRGKKTRTNPIFFALCLLLRRRSGWMRCAARSLSPTVRKPSGSSKRRSTTPSLTTSTRARSEKFALSTAENMKLSKRMQQGSRGLQDHHWRISERKVVLAFLAGEWQLGFPIFFNHWVDQKIKRWLV